MNLTCHDASNIAHNWQLIPSNLDCRRTEEQRPQYFQLPLKAEFTIVFPRNEWGQSSQSLLPGDSERVEASPPHEAAGQGSMTVFFFF